MCEAHQSPSTPRIVVQTRHLNHCVLNKAWQDEWIHAQTTSCACGQSSATSQSKQDWLVVIDVDIDGGWDRRPYRSVKW